MNQIKLWIAAAALAIGVTQAHAECFNEAGDRYSVSPALLKAIAHTESRLNPKAVNKNTNGSKDYGLMQINSSWLPKLKTFGITLEDLWDPCTNTMVGAWILSDNIKRLGYNWKAVGAYNAVSKDKQDQYAIRVYSSLKSKKGI